MFVIKHHGGVLHEDWSLYKFISQVPSEIRLQILQHVEVPEVLQQFYHTIRDITVRRQIYENLCYIVIDQPCLENDIKVSQRINTNTIYLSTKSQYTEIFPDYVDLMSFESEHYMLLKGKESRSVLACILGMCDTCTLRDERGYLEDHHDTVEEVLRSKTCVMQSDQKIYKTDDFMDIFCFWNHLRQSGKLKRNVIIEVYNFEKLIQSEDRNNRFRSILAHFGIYISHLSEPINPSQQCFLASFSVSTPFKTLKDETVNIGLNFVGIDKHNQ